MLKLEPSFLPVADDLFQVCLECFINALIRGHAGIADNDVNPVRQDADSHLCGEQLT